MSSDDMSDELFKMKIFYFNCSKSILEFKFRVIYSAVDFKLWKENYNTSSCIIKYIKCE